ncbi:hypothetical protein D7V82_04950 [bacterium 1xD8-6]|nr:hypothetical protein D7V72_05630 [bacterium D16-36]RKI71917.1 hypothetical protein D7V82_04950 [bacterium 1xD8-6]
MIYLEAYKFFKRKLVCVLLIGIFFLVAVPEIIAISRQIPDYDKLQGRINTYEKHNGIFTEQTAEKFLLDYKEILSDKEMEDLYYESEHLKMLADTLPNIGFNIIFGFYGEWQMSLAWLIDYMQYIPVFVAVAISGIFTYDKSYGMQEIMLSAKNGRKKCTKAKVILAFLVTNSMLFVVALITSLKLLLFTGGRGWNTSIQLAFWLSDSPLDMSFGVLWLHTLFLSFLAINMILLITLSVSFLANSPVTAMCVSLGILFLLRPDVIEIYLGGVEALNKIISLTPYNIINTYKLAERIPLKLGEVTVHWIYIIEVLYSVLLLVGGIFFFQKLIKNYKYFAS